MRLRFWGILLTLASVVPVTLMILLRLSYRSTTWLLALTTCIALAGEWLLTSPDPGDPPSDRLLTARRIARCGVIVAGARLIVNWMMGSLLLPPTIRWFLFVCLTMAALLMTIADLAELTYLAQIAERIPSGRIAGFAKRLRVPLAVSMALALVWGAIETWILVFLPSTVFTLFMLIRLCIYGGVFVISILQLILLARVRRALSRQLLASRQHWAARPHARPEMLPPVASAPAEAPQP